MADIWTIKRLLEWTSEYFAKQGSESPRLDAEILLAHALGLQRIELYTNFETEPPDEPRTRFRELVKRRAAGEPVAYLVGRKEFFSISFEVDAATLIPRPETELLVLEAIDFLKECAEPEPRVLDVGTGSGCIAVAVAKNMPNARITAIDLSKKALEVARCNILKHGLSERVKLLHSDMLANVPPQEFALIVSNPPYVSELEYAELMPEVRDFEPKTALLAGATGTESIRRLIDAAPPFLKREGMILIELSPMIAEACLELLAAEIWTDGRLVKDHARRDRILAARKR